MTYFDNDKGGFIGFVRQPWKEESKMENYPIIFIHKSLSIRYVSNHMIPVLSAKIKYRKVGRYHT